MKMKDTRPYLPEEIYLNIFRFFNAEQLIETRLWNKNFYSSVERKVEQLKNNIHIKEELYKSLIKNCEIFYYKHPTNKHTSSMYVQINLAFLTKKELLRNPFIDKLDATISEFHGFFSLYSPDGKNFYLLVPAQLYQAKDRNDTYFISYETNEDVNDYTKPYCTLCVSPNEAILLNTKKNSDLEQTCLFSALQHEDKLRIYTKAREYIKGIILLQLLAEESLTILPQYRWEPYCEYKSSNSSTCPFIYVAKKGKIGRRSCEYKIFLNTDGQCQEILGTYTGGDKRHYAISLDHKDYKMIQIERARSDDQGYLILSNESKVPLGVNCLLDFYEENSSTNVPLNEQNNKPNLRVTPLENFEEIGSNFCPSFRRIAGISLSIESAWNI